MVKSYVQYVQQTNRPNRFSIPEREPAFYLAKVEDIIEFSFRNKELRRQAFTHQSYKTIECESYKRLEYLGDSVLSLGIAKLHFLNYQKMTPGKLTVLKQANVNKEFLARSSLMHGRERFVRHRIADIDQDVVFIQCLICN